MKQLLILSLLTFILSACATQRPSIVETEVPPSAPVEVEVTSTGSVPSYYDELAKTCRSNGESASCCLDSVELMRKGGYKEKEGEMCPTGFAEYSQECPDAKVWCAPLVTQ